MTIHEEVKLRCEVAVKLQEIYINNLDYFNSIDVLETVLEQTEFIVDNAIEKSYEVKK